MVLIINPIIKEFIKNNGYYIYGYKDTYGIGKYLSEDKIKITFSQEEILRMIKMSAFL